MPSLKTEIRCNENKTNPKQVLILNYQLSLAATPLLQSKNCVYSETGRFLLCFSPSM